MNLLQKQGFFNSLILYAGVALGFFNLIILFQRFLTIEEIGFFNLLIAISTLYVQIASPGLTSIILRYFPYYRSDDKIHGGFVTFISWFGGISFLIVTGLFILFKEPITHFYQEKKGGSLLTQYYYYLIPLSFFTLVFTILEGLARTLFKNILSAFLREVVLRICTAITVCLIFLKLANYTSFIFLYTLANGLIVLILWWNLTKEKHFKLSPISEELHQNKKEIIRYGFFAVLSGSSFVLIQTLDTIMLSAMTAQSMAFVGIYATFFGVATVISLPAKALNRTSYQIISEAWHNKDQTKIAKIYHKTSVVQCLIGCLLLIGMIINKEHLISLLHKPNYVQYFDVFIVLGLAFLVDITGGLNIQIINSSAYYKIVTFFLVAAVVLVIALNILLIPTYGMMGAAISYLITTTLLNLVYFFFIKIKFGFQPFGKAHLLIILISTICLLIGLYIPRLTNQYLDFFIRSTITTLLFSSSAYFLAISKDINKTIHQILFRII
jgi:O-antigen/teichoic acid export membrane protein